MTPWTDRSGKFSPLKAAVLAGACLPALLLAWAALSGTLAPAGSLGPLGARPITEAIHETGDWAIRFLMMSLAVTPLRRIANWPKLILVRRMLGLDRAVLRADASDALHRRPQARHLSRRLRDRAALLSHHRLRRASWPDSARLDLHRRRHQAARPELEPPAQDRLRDRRCSRPCISSSSPRPTSTSRR